MTRRNWFRLGLAALAVFAVCLAVASLATAQTSAGEPPPSVPMRVEIGGTAGLTVGLPEFGMLASVPLEKGSSLEVIVARMPAIWDGPPHLFAQVQVRLPFREHLRSRKSFLLGVTRLGPQRRGEDGGSSYWTFVRPHAGVSLQWPVAQTLDFRLDLQGLLLFESELPMVPRAMTAFVWHPRGRR